MSNDKHIIEGYEERASMQLAGRIVILAEKPGADDPYMVVNCKWDNPLGVDEYFDCAVTTDYLEAVREFIKRETVLLDSLEADRARSGLPFHTLTAADCIPKSMDEDLTGKLIVIKPTSLAHEYRSAEHQIMRVDHGNGTRPNALGRAVFCTGLFDGKQVRHNRHQVAGVIDPAKMPEWAKVKLAELQSGKERPSAALDGAGKSSQEMNPSVKKPTLQNKLNAAKDTAQKAAASKDEHGGKPKNRGGMEVD